MRLPTLVPIQLETGSYHARRQQAKRGQWSPTPIVGREAQTKAKNLEKNLENLLQGKTVRRGVTVEAAINEWLEFREKNRLTNTKPKLMGQKLIDWCEKNGILLLTAVTTDRVMKFRMSLRFRTGDSSSLKVHWAVINGFFNWAQGMRYIDANPIPADP